MTRDFRHELAPIGVFRGSSQQRYELPPQPGLAGAGGGTIELFPRRNFETALEDLSGFSHLWVLFWFHQAHGWRPKVQPPHREGRRGVFATRSPHRPNPIGLSCLRLVEIRGRRLQVAEADLLDETPILDLKPYLPYTDVPTTPRVPPWVAQEIPHFTILWEPRAANERDWLHHHGVRIAELVAAALGLAPYPRRSHRVEELGSAGELVNACFACRTWRVHFQRDDRRLQVRITRIESGHSPEVLAGAPSPWQDVDLHRQFLDRAERQA